MIIMNETLIIAIISYNGKAILSISIISSLLVWLILLSILNFYPTMKHFITISTDTPIFTIFSPKSHSR